MNEDEFLEEAYEDRFIADIDVDDFVEEEEKYSTYAILNQYFPWINANDGNLDEGFFDA